MTTSVKEMMEVANAAVSRISQTEAREMIAKGDPLVVDVRDPPEAQYRMIGFALSNFWS